MKKYKEFNQLVFEFGDDINKFVNNYAGRMPAGIKSQLYELMHLQFSKELDAMSEQEQMQIKYQNKFYDKLFRAKMKLATKDRADAWFDKVFQKYFNRGILEHLIVYGIMFLLKKDLFVPQRLFKQINNDELLAKFTMSACEYLGWTGQNEAVEQSTTHEIDSDDKRSGDNEIEDEDNVAEANKAEGADVVVYEPKQVQPAEQQSQPVMKVERTVTHEVVTATQAPIQNAISETATDNEMSLGVADESNSLPLTEEKAPPRFFTPGGKPRNKS